MLRKCTKCKKEKTLSEFSRNKRLKDGYSYWCRVCWAKYSTEWRKRQGEAFKEYRKEYNARYQREHRAELRQRRRARRLAMSKQGET